MKNKIDKNLLLLLSFYFISSNLIAMDPMDLDLAKNGMDYEIQQGELEPEKDFEKVFFSSLTGDKYPIPRSIIAKTPAPFKCYIYKYYISRKSI